MNSLIAALVILSVSSISAYASENTAVNSAKNETDITKVEKTGEFDSLQPLHQPSHFQMVVCYSQDHHGYTYSATGYLAHDVQHRAHHECEESSEGACSDLGCRYY